MTRLETPSDLAKLREEIVVGRDSRKPCITICSGTGCRAFASERVSVAFEEELRAQGLESKVDIRRTGCHGFCEKGPLVVIYPEGICYLQVKPDDVPEIITETVVGKEVVERLLYVDPNTAETIAREEEIPFYKYQTRMVFGNNNKIDPQNIDDYIALDGYSALPKALFDMDPEQIVQTVTDSGLQHVRELVNLEYLYLGGTQITDGGLEHLEGLTKLRVLVLAETQVSDAGLEHLKGLATLEKVTLHFTQVTDAGVADLVESLPRLQVAR